MDIQQKYTNHQHTKYDYEGTDSVGYNHVECTLKK